MALIRFSDWDSLAPEASTKSPTPRTPSAERRSRVRRPADAVPGRVVAVCSLALVALVAVAPVFAGDCVRDNYGTVYCGAGDCLMDSSGKVHCARRGGGVLRDQYGNVLCGVGYCMADDTGRLLCSSTPGGSVARDSYGKVTCQSGCRDAQAALCEDVTARAPGR